MTREVHSRSGVPDSGKTDPRTWAKVVNQALAGKSNNVGVKEAVSLAALPLTITDDRVGLTSFIGICPLNDHGEFVRVQSVANGSFVVAVTQLATAPIEPTSADFLYVVIG
jgi:hypothetical protein